MAKIYYSITEVCAMLKIKPHNIRYWETEIPSLKTNGKRSYSRKYTLTEIEFLKEIKSLIYDRKFSLEGAAKEIRRKKNNNIEPNEKAYPQSYEESTTNKKSKKDLAYIKKELLEIKELLLKRL